MLAAILALSLFFPRQTETDRLIHDATTPVVDCNSTMYSPFYTDGEMARCPNML